MATGFIRWSFFGEEEILIEAGQIELRRGEEFLTALMLAGQLKPQDKEETVRVLRAHGFAHFAEAHSCLSLLGQTPSTRGRILEP